MNSISEPFIENANVAAIEAPGFHELWSISGLTNAPSVSFCGPHLEFLADCASQVHVKGQGWCVEYGMRTLPRDRYPPPYHRLVLAQVKYIHVRDVLAERGTIDLTKFKSVARMPGDTSYARVGDAFRLPCLGYRGEQHA